METRTETSCQCNSGNMALIINTVKPVHYNNKTGRFISWIIKSLYYIALGDWKGSSDFCIRVLALAGRCTHCQAKIKIINNWGLERQLMQP